MKIDPSYEQKTEDKSNQKFTCTPAELDPFLLVAGLQRLLPHLVVGLDVLGFENSHHG